MTRVRGKKDGDLLGASFDGAAKKAFSDLNQTNVLLLLSIQGNSFCCKEFLQATVQNAVKVHKKSTLLVADEVYWHNLKLQEKPTELEIIALKSEALSLGNKYLDENIPFIFKGLGLSYSEFKAMYPALEGDCLVDSCNKWFNKKNLSVEIVRWNQWVTNQWPEYLSVKDSLYELYDENPLLKASIIKTAEDFSRRHGGISELWKMRSHDYLLEESPAVIWLAAKLGYQFIAYPGKKIAPFQATQTLLINPSPDNDETVPDHLRISVKSATDLVNWLEINFWRSESNVLLADNPLALTTRTSINFFQPAQQLSPQQKLLLDSVQLVTQTLGIFTDDNISPNVKLEWMIQSLQQVKETIDSIPASKIEILPDSSNLLHF